MFNTAPYEDKAKSAIGHFQDELKKIQTGRAHPSMLDGVAVDAYGTKMPLNQVATITAPEPQLIQVSPFDPANVEVISEAIRANQTLGLNPSDDGRIVRVPIPQLTEERRHLLVKQLGEKVEDCRIVLRSIRQDALKDAKAMKQDKQLSEDDYKRVEKEFDGLIAEFHKNIDETAKVKEKEVLTI